MKPLRVVLLAGSTLMVWIALGARAQTPAVQASAQSQTGSPASTNAEAPTTSTAATPPAHASPSRAQSDGPHAAIRPEDLARQIYDAAYRMGYFLGTLTPDTWKMRDAPRKGLEDTLTSLRTQLKTLEERRYRFSGQPSNPALGQDMASSIGALRPGLDLVVSDLAKYWGAPAAAPFKQAEEQLLSLKAPLHQYLASLGAPASKPSAPSAEAAQPQPAAPSPQPGSSRAESPSASAGALPERAAAPTTGATPPAGSSASTTEIRSMVRFPTPVQAQSHPLDLARQIYDAAYLMGYFVGTLTPDTWKMRDASRKSLEDTLASLRSQLKTLEERRYRFSGQPSNPALGQDVASSIGALRPGLDLVVSNLAKYWGAPAAAPFKQAEEQLLSLEAPLHQYLASLGAPASKPSAPSAEAAQPQPPAPSAQPNAAPATSTPANTVFPTATATAPAASTIPPSGPPPGPSAPAPSLQTQTEAQAPAQTQVHPQDLAREIYDAVFRVNDLMDTLTLDNWKMDDASRKSFDDTLASLRSELKTLEERRYKFSGQLSNVALGKDVASGISAARPDLDVLVGEVARYHDATAFKQAEQRLVSLTQPLEQYLASLESPPAPAASSGTSAAGGNTTTVETEQIVAAPSPPASNLLLVSGAITPQQMKDLTHEIYVAAYRVKDLLSLVNPADWKISDTARASLQDEVGRLRDALKTLNGSTAELAQDTRSLPSAFGTYKGIPPVISGIDRIADALGQYQSADVASQLRQPATWLGKAQVTLGGYFEQMLKRQWGIEQNYEAGLASCQNRLNYAMYGHTAAATTMINIMPVLKGKHVRQASHQPGQTLANAALAGGTRRDAPASRVAGSSRKSAGSARHAGRRRNSRSKTPASK